MDTNTNQVAQFAVNQRLIVTKTAPMSVFRKGDEVRVSRVSVRDGITYLFVRGPVHSGYVSADAVTVCL